MVRQSIQVTGWKRSPQYKHRLIVNVFVIFSNRPLEGGIHVQLYLTALW